MTDRPVKPRKRRIVQASIYSILLIAIVILFPELYLGMGITALLILFAIGATIGLIYLILRILPKQFK